MKKSFKLALCSFLAIAIVISSVAIFDVKLGKNDYIDTLTNIYEEYDLNLTQEQINEPFGYNRLVVSGYDGNEYNASKVAYDKENDMAVLQYETKQDAIDAYNQMISNGLVVDPDTPLQIASASTTAPSDVNQSYTQCDMSPNSSNMIGFPGFLNNYKMDSDEVIVAVVDTGVMLEHTYLKDRFYSRGYDLSADKNADADYGKYVAKTASTHSTMISGIIANNTNKNVKILPIKVTTQGSTSASASCVESAINLAVNMGANVINLSMNGPGNASIFNRVINNAKAKGVSVCVSSGNQGVDMANYYPASVPAAIAVGAIHTNKDYLSFSNFGKELDFVAPGSYILSSAPDEQGNSSYIKSNGTSFSAPYVTSCIANLLSIDSNASVDEIYDFMLTRVEDLGDPGRDAYFGHGLITMDKYNFTTDSYSYKIPEGTLDIFNTVDFTESTQPWSTFNSKIKTVTIADTVKRIGDYNFYNMSSASFNIKQKFESVGKYAFYGCSNLKSIDFDISLKDIGACAFGNLGADFVINGYDNTPAELYAKSENIKYNSLGCNHNYIVDVVEPTATQEGYTLYTCCVCNHSYKGPYVEPKILLSGKCGNDLTYSFYDIGKLIISGTGDMYDYINESAPWSHLASQIKILEISNGVNKISPLAFYGANNLIKIKNNSSSYTVVDEILYSNDLTRLVLYPGGISTNTLTIKESVNKLNPEALIGANKINNIVCNSNFVFENNVLYDSLGNIVLFMPYYSNSNLTFNKPITIYNNAMILCDSVDTFVAEHPNVIVEDYAIGFKYEGKMVKRAVTFKGCDKALVEKYASDNGFTYVPLTMGYCGDELIWHYDEKTACLSIDGSGAMDNYASAIQVPWEKYLPTLSKLVIGENVTKLSKYAFYNATSLTDVLMPLSIKACDDDTTWLGCTNIINLDLTYGTGYMDDYGTDYQQIIYQYTPWYVSRKSIKNLRIDPNVKYVGSFTFRYCIALKNLRLVNCERLKTAAFIGCNNLIEATIESENTVIEDYALYSYNDYGYHVRKGCKLYGKVGSTTQKYCDKFGVEFLPIGCAHYIKGTVSNKSNLAIENVLIYVDDVLKAKTNIDGEFICSNNSCGEHTYRLEYNSVVLAQGSLNIEHTNYCANINATIGDYVSDGIINTKDYAEASKLGYPTENIDLGEIVDIGHIAFESYSSQKVPSSELVIERRANSLYCDYSATKDFLDTEYTITECGFLYGTNMPNEFMILENVGKSVGNSSVLRITSTDIATQTSKMAYGIKAGQGTVCGKFYVKYTNGVENYVSYSNYATYTY